MIVRLHSALTILSGLFFIFFLKHIRQLLLPSDTSHGPIVGAGLEVISVPSREHSQVPIPGEALSGLRWFL